MLWCLRLIGVGVGRFDGINGNHWQREQLAGAGDVVGALAAGEQAIVMRLSSACRCASFSSRVRKSSCFSRSAAEEPRRRAAVDALLRFGTVGLRCCIFEGLW